MIPQVRLSSNPVAKFPSKLMERHKSVLKAATGKYFLVSLLKIIISKNLLMILAIKNSLLVATHGSLQNLVEKMNYKIFEL